ncbi:tetratricopeptide repeat protein [Metabacillus halosaccharovorans]|uniref:Tetratricopeptide repeat protein n=1 Tax=Metabacillus halosaccharovorans TaxID=930124 RepID=A0ABT3DE21_9BACI|nr:tetratricopeptide repeat protein [Metabacillus halosaccharovorans]MCV9885197.1 tetratricopeptide repeat protein [Metabacillus halosaccharovorans]
MKQKKNNVVLFPNLKERYLDKGMALLEEKKFHAALDMFAEAKKLKEDKAEIHLGMAICLMELGELSEAKDICKKMLQEDIGHYFTVLQIYLTILIQLREYQEVQSTIEAVLEENHLPAESAEHFYKLLEFSRRMNQNSEELLVEEEEQESNEEIYVEDLLQDPQKQMGYVHSLRDRNINKHINTLRLLLEGEEVHPTIKSMILHVMIEHELEKEVTVVKFGEAMNVVPAELKDPADVPFAKKVLNYLDDTLGSENPTLFEAVKEVWIRHLYVMYPFLPQPEDVKLWAAALHVVGYSLHGISIEDEEIEQIYAKSALSLQEACEKIYKIEEISYFQI